MVTTVHIMCMPMVLYVHTNLCMLLILLCKNNLNLPMCSFFFLPCTWLPPLVYHVVMFAMSLHCADFVCLFVFTENIFVTQPKTRKLLVNLKAGFHSSCFGDRTKYHWIQSNLYNRNTLETTQKWSSWTGGRLMKHLHEATTSQIWWFWAGF